VTVGDEPPIAGRVGRTEAEHRDARAVRDRAAHRLQRFGGDQRRVAKNHQDIVRPPFDRGARREHRMRGAAPFRLDEHFGLGQRATRLRGDRVRIRPDHHGGPVDAGAAHRRQHMRQQRTPGDRVQHLRTRRTHARPFAGGEHDREASLPAHFFLGGGSEVRSSDGAVILGERAGGKVESGDW
jgi:hypothetical protein